MSEEDKDINEDLVRALLGDPDTEYLESLSPIERLREEITREVMSQTIEYVTEQLDRHRQDLDEILQEIRVTMEILQNSSSATNQEIQRSVRNIENMARRAERQQRTFRAGWSRNRDDEQGGRRRR